MTTELCESVPGLTLGRPDINSGTNERVKR
jgi:hypothetical protein